jgi:hypothetical protein
MLLKDRDWSFPMEKLDRRVFECFPPARAEKFCLVLEEIRREWDFLSLIWKRLQNEYREFYTCEEAFQSLEKLKLSRREISDFTRRKMLSFDLIHLDTEDLILHAKILLDIVAILAKFFFKETMARRGYQPRNGFTSFREWFLEPKNSNLILDIQFADYLKYKTNWFEKLKNARDDLIVHRYRERKGKHELSYYTNAITAEGKVAKAIGEFIETEDAVHYKIKKMPDVEPDSLLDGISAFLHFFDDHFSKTLGAMT